MRFFGDSKHWNGGRRSQFLSDFIYHSSTVFSIVANSLLDLCVTITLELSSHMAIQITIHPVVVLQWTHSSCSGNCCFSFFKILDGEVQAFAIVIKLGLLRTVVSNVRIGLHLLSMIIWSVSSFGDDTPCLARRSYIRWFHFHRLLMLVPGWWSIIRCPFCCLVEHLGLFLNLIGVSFVTCCCI